MPLAILGIGACANGIADWPQLQSILSGHDAHVPSPLGNVTAASLPPTERRRANVLSHVALRVGAEAICELPPELVPGLATVFSSAHGDGQVLAQMLDSLAREPGALSSTLFHNSVFNAPAGYWSIAMHCEGPSTMVCAGDASFAAGLIEACAKASSTHEAILYVSADVPFPASLAAYGVDHAAFACAVLLAPAQPLRDASCGSIGEWTISASDTAGAGSAPLGDFFAHNAAASSLPLLTAVALRRKTTVRLPYLDGTMLDVAYMP